MNKEQNQIQAKKSSDLAWYEDDKKLQLVKNTVAKGATMEEFQLFCYTAKRVGLDPLAKQIYFVKRKEQMTIQTGIDGYRAIAERTKQLAGIDDAIYEISKDGKPLKASVTIRRLNGANICTFTASARWSEYAPTGNQAFMWNKMPFLMLGKCAEALALRKAFPNDLSGIYTSDEMEQADNQTIIKPDIEPVKLADLKEIKEPIHQVKNVSSGIKTEPIKVAVSEDRISELQPEEPVEIPPFNQPTETEKVKFENPLMDREPPTPEESTVAKKMREGMNGVNLPKAPSDTIPNKYAGKCYKCGKWIEEKMGALEKQDGKYLVRCHTC